MTKRVVEHEIKLEKSVKIILGVLALGVLLNVFAPAFSVREAFAELSSFDTISVNLPGIVTVDCLSGCN
jgi:hypothetical protein